MTFKELCHDRRTEAEPRQKSLINRRRKGKAFPHIGRPSRFHVLYSVIGGVVYHHVRYLEERSSKSQLWPPARHSLKWTKASSKNCARSLAMKMFSRNLESCWSTNATACRSTNIRRSRSSFPIQPKRPLKSSNFWPQKT